MPIVKSVICTSKQTMHCAQQATLSTPHVRILMIWGSSRARALTEYPFVTLARCPCADKVWWPSAYRTRTPASLPLTSSTDCFACLCTPWVLRKNAAPAANPKHSSWYYAANSSAADSVHTACTDDMSSMPYNQWKLYTTSKNSGAVSWENWFAIFTTVFQVWVQQRYSIRVFRLCICRMCMRHIHSRILPLICKSNTR